MKPHSHVTVDAILVYGLSAILVINVARITALPMSKSKITPVAWFGNALGKVTTFGGTS